MIRNMALSTIGVGGGYATLQAVFGDKKIKLGVRSFKTLPVEF